MKRIILLSILLGVWGLNGAFADVIYVQGDVSGTWSADSVMVLGDVNVPTGATLTIEPGVRIFFLGHFKLHVHADANLQAVGTQQDSIFFTASNIIIGFFGMRFDSSSASSRLAYCHINYSYANDA